MSEMQCPKKWKVICKQNWEHTLVKSAMSLWLDHYMLQCFCSLAVILSAKNALRLSQDQAKTTGQCAPTAGDGFKQANKRILSLQMSCRSPIESAAINHSLRELIDQFAMQKQKVTTFKFKCRCACQQLSIGHKWAIPFAR